MKLRILGWRAKNLRGYLREVEIDLSNQPKRWTLLQMPNGTGKTTTMALLRAAFNGRSLPPEEIMSFRADDTVTDGLFECFLDIDDIRHEVRLLFDFRKPSLYFQTLVPNERSGGLRDGYHLPPTLRDTLRAGVTELFVFDGELAASIISEGATHADQAICTLYRLDLLNDLVTDIQRQVEQRRRAARFTKISTPARIATLQQEFSDALSVHKRLLETERKLQLEVSDLKIARKSIENEIASIARGKKEFQQEQFAIEDELRKVNGTIKALGDEVLTLFRSPPQVGPAFRQRLEALGGTLENKKLPRSMSREFFTQLASSDICVCGRPITTHARRELLEHMDNYLGQDEIAVINQMKTRLRAVSPKGETFASQVEVLRQTLASLHFTEQREERLRDRMKEEGLDIVEQLEGDLETHSKRLILAEDTLNRLTRDTGGGTADWRNNLAACSKELRERRKRLATAEGTYEYRRKADKLISIVKTAKTSALARLRKRIRERTNNFLNDVLVNEMIHIAAIDGHLRLTGDAAFKKDSVSEGQKLAVAYAFLAALLADARYQLPLIVDSPAVSLDVELRRTVGGLIPPLFGQMLMFVISSEREGFADSFYDHGDARFLTVSLDPVTGRTGVEEGTGAFRSFHSKNGVEL